MKIRTKLNRLFQKKPVLTYTEMQEVGAYYALIKKMCEVAELEEVSRGCYRLVNAKKSQYEDLENISARIPDSIFCLLTALDFHGIGTQRAFEYHVAIPKKKTYPRVSEYNFEFYKYSDASFFSGIEDHGTFKIYNPSKTIADCFKFRNRIGLDVALEALKDVVLRNIASPSQIIKQSEICKVKETVIPYLEVLQ